MLVGPATFLLLAKGDNPFDRLGELIDVYARILGALADAGVAWVQLDEPAYVADRTAAEIDALRAAYPPARRTRQPAADLRRDLLR